MVAGFYDNLEEKTPTNSKRSSKNQNEALPKRSSITILRLEEKVYKFHLKKLEFYIG